MLVVYNYSIKAMNHLKHRGSTSHLSGQITCIVLCERWKLRLWGQLRLGDYLPSSTLDVYSGYSPLSLTPKTK